MANPARIQIRILLLAARLRWNISTGILDSARRRDRGVAATNVDTNISVIHAVYPCIHVILRRSQDRIEALVFADPNVRCGNAGLRNRNRRRATRSPVRGYLDCSRTLSAVVRGIRHCDRPAVSACRARGN